MRSLLLLALLVVSTGCPNYVPYLPDGGRARVNCNNSAVNVPITVLDRAGMPSPDAVVEVEYLSYGESENLITDGRGIALLTDKYGPGVVRLIANVNDLRSDVAEVTFNGTECSTSVVPRSLTLPVK
ncbi:MAG: hypothetical protein JNM17_06085 [Archangium sp.]|nr:hypothetical protein [Archangium sp.]